MTTAGTFGDMREALHQAPSVEGWRAVCAGLERQWRDDPERLTAEALPYAERLLQPWPDALRVCPARWVVRAGAGTPCPMLRLVRALDWSAPPDEVTSAEPPRQRVRDLPLVGRLLMSVLPPEAPERDDEAQTDLLDAPWAPWGKEALGRALAPEALAHLRVLRLGGHPLGERGMGALARATTLRALVELDLRRASLGDPMLSLVQLAQAATRLPALEVLRLDDCDLTSSGLLLLGFGGEPFGVRRLSLSLNPLQSAQEAFVNGSFPQLRALDLSRTAMDERAVRDVVELPTLKQLRELDVSGLGLSDELMYLLGGAPGLARLEALALRENALTDEGLRLLAASPYTRGLVELDLRHNPITRAGLEALATSPHLRPELVVHHHLKPPA